MSMTEPNADDSRTDPRPPNGPVSGHAAVGFVVGQRFEDGSAPDHVLITYRRRGRIGCAYVRRESAGQQVEDTGTDSVRFAVPFESGTLRVDAVLAAEPAEVDL